MIAIKKLRMLTKNAKKTLTKRVSISTDHANDISNEVLSLQEEIDELNIEIKELKCHRTEIKTVSVPSRVVELNGGKFK